MHRHVDTLQEGGVIRYLDVNALYSWCKYIHFMFKAEIQCNFFYFRYDATFTYGI